MHAHGGSVAADAMRTVSSIMVIAASSCSPGGVLSLLRHMATMNMLAALGWSIYVHLVRVQDHTSRRRHRGTAGSSASKSGENENSPGTIESRLSAIQRGI